MLALQATSDELQKYDVVTEQLRAYAGPQCYPHVDRSSAECRLAAQAPGGGSVKQGDDGASQVEAVLAREECWRCCDSCGKWRLIDGRCLPALASECGFLEERETDLDWATWLSKAAYRYRIESCRWEAGVAGAGGEVTVPDGHAAGGGSGDVGARCDVEAVEKCRKVGDTGVRMLLGMALASGPSH